MVSAERVLGYCRVPQEASLESEPGCKPKDDWPANGTIAVRVFSAFSFSWANGCRCRARSASFPPVRRCHRVGCILQGCHPHLSLPPPIPWSVLLHLFLAQIRDMSMRYREDLPPVLKGLTLSIRGGSRVGVVGRTGAGKSSLISALFRLVEYDRDRYGEGVLAKALLLPRCIVCSVLVQCHPKSPFRL